MRVAGAKGYALVSAIWILAALVLITGYMASRIAIIQESIRSAADEQNTKLDKKATLSTLLYLGSTQGVTYGGIPLKEVDKEDGRINDFLDVERFTLSGEVLRLDNRIYKGVGGVDFSLQDTGPLVSLVVNDRSQRLEDLLEYYGIRQDEREILVAALKDYVDRDELASLNGAERRSYEEIGMLRPTNRFLLSPTQIMNVKGWTGALGFNVNSFIREITPVVGNNYNFNTLTAIGLLNIDDLNKAAVKEILEYRKEGFFKSIGDVNQLVDVLVPVDPLEFGFIPSTSVRVSMSGSRESRENLIGITFTPMSGFGP